MISGKKSYLLCNNVFVVCGNKVDVKAYSIQCIIVIDTLNYVGASVISVLICQSASL